MDYLATAVPYRTCLMESKLNCVDKKHADLELALISNTMPMVLISLKLVAIPLPFICTIKY